MRRRRLFVPLFAMVSAMIFVCLRNLRFAFILQQMFELIQDTKGFKNFIQKLICQRKRARSTPSRKRIGKTIGS
jgi:hypothetical protein